MKRWKAATISGTLFTLGMYGVYTFFRLAASGRIGRLW